MFPLQQFYLIILSGQEKYFRTFKSARDTIIISRKINSINICWSWQFYSWKISRLHPLTCLKEFVRSNVDLRYWKIYYLSFIIDQMHLKKQNTQTFDGGNKNRKKELKQKYRLFDLEHFLTCKWTLLTSSLSRENWRRLLFERYFRRWNVKILRSSRPFNGILLSSPKSFDDGVK